MTNLLQVLIAAGILSISLFTINSYAENANCSGDCEAPTLGVLDDGHRVIDNGLTINGRTFPVNHQIQTNPTMSITTGNTAKVKLMIYENNGAESLRHASIAISDYQDDKNRNDLAKISFDQDFTGAQSFEVMDSDEILKNVDVTATQLDLWRTEMVYSFKIVKPFDTSSLIVEMWDDDASSRTNVFVNAIKSIGDEIVDTVQAEPVPYVAPPLQQTNNGIASENVTCREGLELVMRTTGSPACVYPFTAEVLRAWGMVA